MGVSRFHPAVAAALGLALCACQGAPRAAAATPPLAKAPDGRPLAVTFDDEFDSFRRFSHGQGVWRTYLRGGDGMLVTERTLSGNKELQVYVDPDWAPEGAPLGLNPFRLHDGQLEIRAEPAPAKVAPLLEGRRYISGMISSQPAFSQTYGYFEMRAKLPRGKGVWPAFWLLPADLAWPPEIDVMESVGDPSKVYATAHSNAVKAEGTEIHVDDPDGFHTYAVAWDKDQIVWFVDGREAKRQPTPPDMHKPMYLLANIALGGDWAGAPDATTPWPARMSIDYIRAYRFAR